MYKKIIFIIVVVLLLAYLAFAVLYLNPKANKETVICTRLSVEVVDNQGHSYLDEKDVLRILQRVKMNPVGKNLSEISLEKMEKDLENDPLIRKADCYKTVSGAVKAIVYQRTPILRVMTANKTYYIDSDGKIMPLPDNMTVNVPIATGFIEDEYAQKQLYELGLFLQKDKFWNAQIEQIYVAPNKDIELSPRVGNHQIVLGKIADYSENLDKLKLFYEKGLGKVGWNKYSIINLKYKNQVVCTKIE
jgi:cell division protein FtsQ